MSVSLSNFWKTVEFHPGTYIAEPDYEMLKQGGVLISKLPVYNNKNTLLYQDLPCEPFMGDLQNASVYIVTLNPGSGEDEHTNWKNPDLLRLWKQNLLQQDTKYPFYYLNPILADTGGGKWWLATSKLANIIGYFTEVFGNRDKALEFVAKNICDIELCPYHSESWSDKHNNVVNKIPSVQATIDFLKDHVIPGVINGTKTLIVLRRVSEINKLLSGVTFDYNGKKIKFDDLDRLFPDRVVFYRTRGLATGAHLNPEAPQAVGGKLLLNRLKELI